MPGQMQVYCNYGFQTWPNWPASSLIIQHLSSPLSLSNTPILTIHINTDNQIGAYTNLLIPQNCLHIISNTFGSLSYSVSRVRTSEADFLSSAYPHNLGGQVTGDVTSSKPLSQLCQRREEGKSCTASPGCSGWSFDPDSPKSPEYHALLGSGCG